MFVATAWDTLWSAHSRFISIGRILGLHTYNHAIWDLYLCGRVALYQLDVNWMPSSACIPRILSTLLQAGLGIKLKTFLRSEQSALVGNQPTANNLTDVMSAHSATWSNGKLVQHPIPGHRYLPLVEWQKFWKSISSLWLLLDSPVVCPLPVTCSCISLSRNGTLRLHGLSF